MCLTQNCTETGQIRRNQYFVMLSSLATPNKYKRDWSSLRSEAKASGWLQIAVTYNSRPIYASLYFLANVIFFYRRVVACAFCALCMCSTFGHHPHP